MTAESRGGRSVLVACLGDVMVDVVVQVDDGLVRNDDVPAVITVGAGGQAANVATWVTALGGRARIFGPQHDSGSGTSNGTGNGTGRLLSTALAAHGVEVSGSATGSGGAVVSVVSQGSRSMASDPGDLAWLDDVRSGPWLDGADWLFVSGYALLRATDPQRIVETAAVARAHGTRIAVDLASASMARRFGADGFASLCRALRPAAVFATDAEWATSAAAFGPGGLSVLVLKHGARGASFVIDGIADTRPPTPGPVVDVTGAGDALAAGFLVGGVDLAMRTAARCVARRGAQPPAPTTGSGPEPG